MQVCMHTVVMSGLLCNVELLQTHIKSSALAEDYAGPQVGTEGLPEIIASVHTCSHKVAVETCCCKAMCLYFSKLGVSQNNM